MLRRHLAASFIALVVSTTLADDQQGIDFFETRIRPVLVEHCYECHQADSKPLQAGLRLDNREAMRQGGESGAAVVPGDIDASLVIAALKYDGFEMPPKGRLPESVIKDFETWIELGAPDPRDGETTSTAPGIDFEKASKFWAFQPPVQAPLPQVQDKTWPKNEIDFFVLHKLEQASLRPVPQADKTTLIRRATFDLLGLPPQPEEVAAFLADRSPHAYERLVDRLLQSPHYGERWGRHWLDVARYADDQAHTFGVRPNSEAWRYRQWVIEAFNADLPYDDFVRMQIAGDHLQESPGFERFVALGYFGLGAVYYKNSDKAKAEADELDDRIDTLTRGFLGLTVSCARCHDHKFDPIPTTDYYSLAGIFNSSPLKTVPLVEAAVVDAYNQGQKVLKDAETKLNDRTRLLREARAEAHTDQISRYLVAIWKQKVAKARQENISFKQLAESTGLAEAALKPWSDFLSPGRRGKHESLASWFALPEPTSETSLEPVPEDVQRVADDFQSFLRNALAERSNPATEKQLSKEKAQLLKEVFGDGGLFKLPDPQFQASVSPEEAEELKTLQSQLDAAKQAAPPMYPAAHAIHDSNPRDAKVFIRGNPARTGEVAPRQFLRILAGEKRSPYQSGSGRRELAEEIASEQNPLTARVMVNRVWHQHFGRGIVGTPSNFGSLGEPPSHPELLDWLTVDFVNHGWSIKRLHRQIMLSATYQLSSETDPHNANVDGDARLLWRMNRRRLDVEAWRDSLLSVAGNLDTTVGGENAPLTGNRRTVYAKISRHDLDELLRLFDFPDANVTSEKRTATTVPQQQLFVLNSKFFIQQAQDLAKQLQATAPADSQRIQHAFQRLFNRDPTPQELQLGIQFLETAKTDESSQKLNAWAQYAQALLSLNEFMFID